MVKRIFDEDLLGKSKKERESFFKDYTISHPLMKQALENLKEEIYNGSQNIIMVVGPSGVGKTRLFNATILSIIKDMKLELEENLSIIPVAGIELPNPDLGKFNWKDFYYRVLSALNEPLIDYKIDINKIRSDRNKIKTTATAPELRRSLENAFFYRNTQALLIDEAQHFFKINTNKNGESEKNQSQFNSIKSLANMSNTKIVLFGTYDLNSVFNLDGQLSRRVKEVHFPRYNYNIEVDKKNFQAILLTFQKLLPVENEPNLKEYSDFIYENCIGCTGILKDWLQRCLSTALENNEKTITLANLKKNALQTKKLLTLAQEAVLGENAFKENNDERENLQALLGTKKNELSEDIKEKSKSKPGIRNPHRDKVGEI